MTRSQLTAKIQKDMIKSTKMDSIPLINLGMVGTLRYHIEVHNSNLPIEGLVLKI